jgi:hypothetical protein
MRYVIRNKMNFNAFWSVLSQSWRMLEYATAVFSEERVNIMLPPNGVWVAL